MMEVDQLTARDPAGDRGPGFAGQVLPIEDLKRAVEECSEAIVHEIDQRPTFAEDLAAAISRSGAAGVRAELKGLSWKLRERLAVTMRLLAATDDGNCDDAMLQS